MKNVTEIKVLYHGRLVGTLRQNHDDPATYFSYAPSWLKEGFSISPFHLPLNEKIYRYDKPHLFNLPGPFYDVLPDRFGNLLMDRYLRSKQINPVTFTPFLRLTLLDDNAMGGFTFLPCQYEEGPVSPTDLDKLHEAYLALIQVQQIDELSFLDAYTRASSVGGSRPKFNLRRKDGLWIVKYGAPSDIQNIGEMEYDYMKAAKKAGLEVSPFELLVTPKGNRYFATKRFDRDQNGKPIHRISLAGLLEVDINFPQIDYVTLLQVVEKLCPQDRTKAYRLMCFNLFSGNFDDHGENFAFLYDEAAKTYRLSPSYDLTTIPNGKYHQLGFAWKDFPTKTDLLNIGAKVGLSKQTMEPIIAEVLSVCQAELSAYYDFLATSEGKSFLLG